MNKSLFESIISKLKNPERVKVFFIENKYACILSADNTNDTFDWFHINSNLLEEELQKVGLAWCYLFETAPSSTPFIYMFVGENLTKEFVENETEEMINKCPEDKEFYLEDGSFSSIDADQYDRSFSKLEQEFARRASDVFRVYKA